MSSLVLPRSMRSLKDQRKVARRKQATDAWIRVNGSFAMTPCKVLDLSSNGVQIQTDAAQAIPGSFNLLMSRNAGSGQRASVKWRQGKRIGVEFV